MLACSWYRGCCVVVRIANPVFCQSPMEGTFWLRKLPWDYSLLLGSLRYRATSEGLADSAPPPQAGFV